MLFWAALSLDQRESCMDVCVSLRWWTSVLTSSPFCFLPDKFLISIHGRQTLLHTLLINQASLVLIVCVSSPFLKACMFSLTGSIARSSTHSMPVAADTLQTPASVPPVLCCNFSHPNALCLADPDKNIIQLCFSLLNRTPTLKMERKTDYREMSKPWLQPGRQITLWMQMRCWRTGKQAHWNAGLACFLRVILKQW